MIGETLAHFRVTDKLGEGGMGVVWRAEDTRLNRQVAIKVLPEAVAGDPERLARFEREAQVLASLNHPNIAAIYGLEEADDRRALVMELVEGETVAERIQRGALSVEEALPFALQIAEALEVAHETGIVHRDLKPANIKITPDGQVKVLDFGLAKALEGDPTGSGSQPAMTQSPTLTAQMTGAGVLLGTAAYMSPEQARGQTADKRADIWAFGVVLMEMLTGRLVYSGDTVSDTLAGVLAREPEWEELPDDTPGAVRNLLDRCLNKEATERLRDIGEARIAIREYIANPVEEEALGAIAVAPETAKWKQVLPWALLAVAVLGLGLALWAGRGEENVPASSVRLESRPPSDRPLHRGYGSAAVLSPDGKRVAFVFGDSAVNQLYLMSLDQWEGIQIAEGTGPDLPYHPFFSPDGRWLGFVTRTEMKKVPVTGGTPITLCEVDFNRGSSWGPDDMIVFAPKPEGGLYQVPAAGGEPQPLTELDTERSEVSHRWPQHLPAGRQILYTAHTNQTDFDAATIQVFDLESGESKVVVQGGYHARFVGSGHLVYVNQSTLFAIPFDLSKLETTGMAAPVVEQISSSTDNGGAHFSISGTGRLIYLTGEATQNEYSVVSVDRDGQQTPLLDDLREFSEPDFSPDGNRLVFSIPSDQNWDIWVYDLVRKVPTRLTFDDSEESTPVWTPDGESIIFSSRQAGSFNLYRKAADGSGEIERLTENEHNQFPSSVSPDGRIVGLTVFDPETQWNIHLLSLEEGEMQPFLVSEFNLGDPRFSPDGQWLAYTSDESGTREVYVRPVGQKKGMWQISSGSGRFPRWSADGSELFFRNDDGEVLIVSVDASSGSFQAGRPEVLIRGDFVFARGFGYYDIAPDSQSFVMLESRGGDTELQHDHVRYVLNWFDELDRTFANLSN